MANIDAFNLVAGGVFSKLYSEFPKPTDLSSENLASEYSCSFDLVAHCIDWLAAEQFIRIGSKSMNWNFLRVVLTQKGLQALSLIPESLGPSLGEQLMDKTREGALDGVKDLAKQVLAGSLQFAIKEAIRSVGGLST